METSSEESGPDATTAPVSLQVTTNEAGFRADRALAALAPDLARREAKELFHHGQVRLNGRIAKAAERVDVGDKLEYAAPKTEGEASATEKGPRLVTKHGLQVARLYEDDELLVIHKPPRIAIHHGPEGKGRRETLEDVLGPAYPPPASAQAGSATARPESTMRYRDDDDTVQGSRGADQGYYFVHRLDLETTGCLVVAKSPEARDALIRQFERRSVAKVYWALCVGEAPWERLTSKRPIAYMRQQVDLDGNPARPSSAYAPFGGRARERDNEIEDDQYEEPYEADEPEPGGEAFGGARGAGNPYNKLARPKQATRPADPLEDERERVPDRFARKFQGKPLRAVKKGIALEEGATEGKSCETRFTVEQRFRGYTLIRCEPRTGRLHQIRVHLAAEGLPLAYDPLYGRRSPLRLRDFFFGRRNDTEDLNTAEIVLNRVPLHAWKIAFSHPKTNERVAVEAPLPRDLKEFMKVLRKYRSLDNTKPFTAAAPATRSRQGR